MSLILIFLLLGLAFSAPLSDDQKATRTPTLMISLDGFRADKLDKFIQENPMSNFKKFADAGVKADYMTPSFPSLTFPNHFTLVTGLYMENHGIVANSFYDADLKEKINFLGQASEPKLDIKWWNKAEPVWMNAKNQGLKTASLFWTGSEVWTRQPDIFYNYNIYNSRYVFDARVEKIVSLFTKFELDFGTLYFNEPDHTGHTYGPDSQEYYNQIIEMDKIIGSLLSRLQQAGILDKMNVIIVSDHGMAQMLDTIIVKDNVDINLIDSTKTVYNIVSNIYAKDPADNEKIVQTMSKNPNLMVYYKEQVPESLHYQNSNRIAPIVVICKEGYILRTSNTGDFLNGNHGFDNSLASMRAIFMARGPDFKASSRISSMKNVDVYPLLCTLLKITCNPNNGTMTPFMNILNSGSLNFALTKLNFESNN